MMNAPMRSAPPAVGSGWRSAVESLSNNEFRWIFASNLSFFLAMGSMQIARVWLVFQLTDSPLALGIVSAAVAIPMLLFSPFGGVLADRVERRGLIITAQTVAIMSELIVLVLLLNGVVAYWHLVCLAAVNGCIFPLIMPARQAIVVNIVGKKHLGNAMALNMAGMNLTRVVGPAAAGFMIPIIGLEGVYIANIALYITAVLAMFRISKLPALAALREVSIASNLADGIRYVRDDKLILTLLLYGLVPMFLAMPFQTLLVVFAEDVWNQGSTGLGILNAAAGIGGVAGSVYVASRGGREERLRAMMISIVGFGGLLALFSFSPWFPPAVLLIFAANIFASIFGTLNNTSIQLLIPDEVRGRISSFLMMSFSLPLLGTLPISSLAERFGAPIAVGTASLLAVLVAFIFYAVSPALRGLDRQIRRASAEE